MDSYTDEPLSQDSEASISFEMERSQEQQKVKTRPSKPPGKCPFIIHEAEMSGDDSSDDESNSICSSAGYDSDQSCDSMNFHRVVDNLQSAQHEPSSIDSLVNLSESFEDGDFSSELFEDQEPADNRPEPRYEDVLERDDDDHESTDDEQPSTGEPQPTTEPQQQPTKRRKEAFIYPLRVEKKEKARHVNLLLTEVDGVKHYSAIIDFSRLVSSQVSKDTRKKHFCYSCLTGFTTRSKDETRENCKRLQEHIELCQQHQPQRVSYPVQGVDDMLTYKNIYKQLPVPFRIYADFEAALVEVFRGDVTTGIFDQQEYEKYLDENWPKCLTPKGVEIWKREMRKAVMYQEHRPISYKYIIVSDVDGYRKEKLYKGDDAAAHMLDELTKDTREIFDTYIKKAKKMIWDDEAKTKYENSTHCHICKGEFKKPIRCISGCSSKKAGEERCKTCKENQCNRKVRDHDHLSGS